MHLTYEEHDIYVNIDSTYTINSLDNRHYDVVLNPSNLHGNDFYKTFEIKIISPAKLILIALIGDFHSYDMECALLKNNILTVLQGAFISQLDIMNGTLLKYKEIDHFGCNFSIHEVSDGYIIYGEIEITMPDYDLNKKWSFSGADIFVSISDKNSFEICGDMIHLFDFNDNYYEIDFEGRQINPF